MNARRIVLIVLIVIFVVLILENRKNVEVDLIVKSFVKSFSIPGALLYPFLLLLGAAFGWVACLIYKKRGDKKNKKDS